MAKFKKDKVQQNVSDHDRLENFRKKQAKKDAEVIKAIIELAENDGKDS